MPSDIAAIVYVRSAIAGPCSTAVKTSLCDLTLHDAKEAAERVAETLFERGFQFVRIKVEKPERGRWQKG